MEGMVKSMGLKGLIIFLLLLVAGNVIGGMNYYGGVGLEAVACILLGLYVDAYFSVQKEVAEARAEQVEKQVTQALAAQQEFLVQTKADLQQAQESLSTKVAEALAGQQEASQQALTAMQTDLVKTKVELQQAQESLSTKVAEALARQQEANEELADTTKTYLAVINTNITTLRDALEANLVNISDLHEQVVSSEKQLTGLLQEHDQKIAKIVALAERSVEQEEIFDKENAALVFNTKKDGVMVHSELRDNNKLTFMAGYKDNRMLYSKSFDEAGNLTNETTYDAKGQVEERRTYRRTGNGITVDVDKY